MRLAVAAALLLACSKPPAAKPNGNGATPPPAARSAVFAAGDPKRDVYEGPSFKNSCGADTDCKTGGCGGEACTAEEGVFSTCDVKPALPEGATCGCVSGECIWWREAGASSTTSPPPSTTTPPPATATPTATDTLDGTPGGVQAGAQGGAAQGQPCQQGKCGAGLTCVSYYGIAGARGPQFTSCEVPCPLSTDSCPKGQKCITIADGPGRVCRPS